MIDLDSSGPPDSTGKQDVQGDLDQVADPISHHSYLTIPSVSSYPLEAHPFTMCGMPTEDGKVTFLMKVRDGKSSLVFIRGTSEQLTSSLSLLGFTKKLADQISGTDTPEKIATYVDGPYGTSTSMNSFSTVLLIAGKRSLCLVVDSSRF